MIPETPQWQLTNTERGPDLQLFKVRFDYQRNLQNDAVVKAVILESADSANVVAITPEKRILLVRQFRFGTQQVTLELPGGLVDPGETALQAAQRELREETGYSADRWEPLGAIASNPVYMDSQIHHFLARDARRTDLLNLDDGEQIDLLEYSIPQVQQMVQSGEIQHPHALSALARVITLWKPLPL